MYPYLKLKYLKSNAINSSKEVVSVSPLITSSDMINLKVYATVYSITANNDSPGTPNGFFIDSKTNMLYQYNINGRDPKPVNGKYLIGVSDNQQLVNKSWLSVNGELHKMDTYFDASNLRLVIDTEEFNDNGLVIMTEDSKIYTRINNIWTCH